MMRSAYHVTLLLCLSIIAAAVVIGMYMLADGIYFGVPMSLKDGGNVTTTQSVYRPGDEVQATITYCKSSRLSGVIDWQLVDTYVRFYPAQHADLPEGCHSYNMDLGQVPSDVGADTYHFTGLLSYKMNALTTVSYPLVSNTFRVETE